MIHLYFLVNSFKVNQSIERLEVPNYQISCLDLHDTVCRQHFAVNRRCRMLESVLWPSRASQVLAWTCAPCRYLVLLVEVFLAAPAIKYDG